MKLKTLWIIAITVFIVYEILNFFFFTTFPENANWLYIADFVGGIIATVILTILLALPLYPPDQLHIS